MMATLNQCSQHYIRCIKPNSHKSPGSFEDQLTMHQIRYLGLSENTKVRRAGFCFRQTYTRFLRRYMMLSPTTWNGGHWQGDARQGCGYVLKALGMKPGEYQNGKTKLFVKNAEGYELALSIPLVSFLLFQRAFKNVSTSKTFPRLNKMCFKFT